MSKWVRGTIDDVRAWLGKETQGMFGKQEDQEDQAADDFWERTTPIDDLNKFINKYVPSEVELHNERVVRDRPVQPTVTEVPGRTGLNHVEAKILDDIRVDQEAKAKGTGRASQVAAIHPPVAPTDYKPNKDWKNWKPTNPKDLMGIRKVSFCCLPWPVLGEAGLGMQEGGMKYGRHNYRSEGVAVSTYVDAVIRHITAYWEGEDIDPDSGIHHIGKAISTLIVLRDAQLNDKATDDRPIKPRNPDWLKELNDQASKLVDKYPQPEAPYCHIPIREDQK
jgi:hypothetical protein